MIENSPSGQIFIKYEQVEKKTVTLLFFILNHYALMLRYFILPKKNQRYANGQRWFYPVRCNYFLAEPASNIETIENNVKHTAPKPTRTREGIKYPISVCAISARNDARKRQNRQVKTGIIGILLANEQVRLQTSASSQTFENML